MSLCPIITAAVISQISETSRGDDSENARTAAVFDRAGDTRGIQEESNTNVRSAAAPLHRPHSRLSAARQRIAQWIVLAWIGGASLLAMRMLGGWLLAHRMARRGIEPHSAGIDLAFKRLAASRRVSRLPRLIVSMAVSSHSVPKRIEALLEQLFKQGLDSVLLCISGNYDCSLPSQRSIGFS